MVFFGYLVGSPVWGAIADKFGRKRVCTYVMYEWYYMKVYLYVCIYVFMYVLIQNFFWKC